MADLTRNGSSHTELLISHPMAHLTRNCSSHTEWLISHSMAHLTLNALNSQQERTDVEEAVLAEAEEDLEVRLFSSSSLLLSSLELSDKQSL